LHDDVRTGAPEGTIFLALRANTHFYRISFANRQFWVTIQELMRQLRSLVKRFQLRLAVIAPRYIDPAWLAEAG
jgi:hypothetical protein